MLERFRDLPLFVQLSEEEVAHLCEHAEEVRLPAGAQLFAEGEHGEHAYLIAEGALEIIKDSFGREVLLRVAQAGEVIGEMALLRGRPRMAGARARGSTTLIRIPKSGLDHVFDTSPRAARALLNVILDRLEETETRLRQGERMAQLGTLAAGLAHELNNPAAAAHRAAGQLRVAVEAYAAARAAAGPELPATVRALLDRLGERAGQAPRLRALERSEREEGIAERLEDLGIADAWDAAPALVDLDLTPGDLDTLASSLDRDEVPRVIALLTAGSEAHELLYEIAESIGRISRLAGTFKSYSYLDQAPVQDVDIAQGIEDTLLILRAKLAGIEVERDYASGLPRIEASGSDLNQVWTNLLDNAADAIRGAPRSDGRIAIRANVDDRCLLVEIEDNGGGIPAEIQHRIFDRFFTTKPPGSGMGLGLDISYHIVAGQHGGDLRLVSSEPGRTVFCVELPRRHR